MLKEKEIQALERWYRRDEILGETRRLIGAEEWDELTEHLQMRCLFPLSRHSELPEYLLDEEGKPLFPTNLNPAKDLEKWQDAVEVGWGVVAEECGMTREEIGLRRDREQEEDWQQFLARYEERKRNSEG